MVQVLSDSDRQQISDPPEVAVGHVLIIDASGRKWKRHPIGRLEPATGVTWGQLAVYSLQSFSIGEYEPNLRGALMGLSGTKSATLDDCATS